MMQCKRKFMYEKMREYKQSKLYNLYSCYNTVSDSKESAYDYCLRLMDKYNGTDLRIIGYNTFTFSVGFIGEYEGRKAFFYITADYDRFMYID